MKVLEEIVYRGERFEEWVSGEKKLMTAEINKERLNNSHSHYT